jgi:hypothetical protein
MLKVGELVATLGLDQKGFDRGMDQAKQKMVAAGKSLSKSFILDPTSLRSLNTEMKKLQDRAAELRRLRLGLTPDDFRRDENAARDLEHELSKVGARMGLLSQASEDLRKRMGRLGEVGDKISGVGRSLSLHLTAPIVAAGVGLFALAKKTSDWAEQLENMSKSTGLSATRLQELKAVADDSGLAFESIANASVMFQRRLLGIEEGSGMATKALKALFGVDFQSALHDATGQFKSMDEIFPQLIQRLQSVDNATARVAIATQLFGRGASDILPLLGMSADEFARLTKEAQASGRVIGDLSGWRQFDKTMDELTGRLKGVGLQLAQAVLPVVKEFATFVVNDVIPVVRNWVKWFNDLSPATKKLIFWVGLAVAALGPLLVVIGHLLSAYSALRLALAVNTFAGLISGSATATGAIGKLSAAIGWLKGIALNPIILRFAVVITGAEALGRLANWASKKLGGPKIATLSEAARMIPSTLSEIVNERNRAAGQSDETRKMEAYIKGGTHSIRKALEARAATLRSAAPKKTPGTTIDMSWLNAGAGKTGGGGGGSAKTPKPQKSLQELADEAARVSMSYMQNMADINQMTVAKHIAGLDKILNREKSYAHISLDVYAQAYRERKSLMDAEDEAAKKRDQAARDRLQQVGDAMIEQGQAIKAQQDKQHEDDLAKFRAVEDSKLRIAQMTGDEETRIQLESQRILRDTYEATGNLFQAAQEAQTYSVLETTKLQTQAAEDAANAIKAVEDGMMDAVTEAVKRLADLVNEQKAKIAEVTQQLVDSIRGIFENAFTNLMTKGFKGMFQSIKSDFMSLLNEMVAQLLASRLMILLGKAFGINIGGAGDNPLDTIFGHRALGGPIAANTPYLVGERGPELFMSRQSGQIIPNGRLAAAGPTSNFHFVFNVSTPSPEAFRRSQSQIIDEAYRAGALAVRRNG